MVQNDICVCNLTYLLTQHSTGEYMGRVLECPAVIETGTTPESVSDKIDKSTKAYLCMFDEEREKIVKGESSRLPISDHATVLETIKFSVEC